MPFTSIVSGLLALVSGFLIGILIDNLMSGGEEKDTDTPSDTSDTGITNFVINRITSSNNNSKSKGKPGVTLEDWIYFFDKVGFADNPDWCGCFCRYYHFAGSNKKWEKQTREENRDASVNLIISGIMHGFLAYLDDNPIGWCNVNSRENYAKELYKYDLEGKQIAGIVCFLISHTYRKQGIARKLMNQQLLGNLKYLQMINL